MNSAHFANFALIGPPQLANLGNPASAIECRHALPRCGHQNVLVPEDFYCLAADTLLAYEVFVLMPTSWKRHKQWV
jgi:hypothetical protein